MVTPIITSSVLSVALHSENDLFSKRWLVSCGLFRWHSKVGSVELQVYITLQSLSIQIIIIA